MGKTRFGSQGMILNGFKNPNDTPPPCASLIGKGHEKCPYFSWTTSVIINPLLIISL